MATNQLTVKTGDGPHDGSVSPARGRSVRFARWVKHLSVLSILVGFLITVRQLPTDRAVGVLSTWVEGLGVWGPVLFGTAYAAAALLFVPGSALTLAAGAVFGLLWGTITVSVASTIAAALAFLIARHLAREMVERKARENRRFAAIDQAIGEGGWKIIAMLRLSPVVPFSLGNYLFGLTRIRFWPHVVTSWLAMLPGTFLYVYLGYLGRAGLAAGGDQSVRGLGEWSLLIVGLVATVAVTVYITRLARKAIRERAGEGIESSTPRTPRDPSTSADRARDHWGTAVAVVGAAIMLAAAVFTSLNRDAIRGLFGPPVVELKENYEEKPDGPTFDHSAYDALLENHVSVDGWVDYEGLRKDVRKLEHYLEALARAPFDDLGRSEKLALLINAYNAFTLRLIVENAPVKSILEIPAGKRWNARRWRVGTHTWSLSQIEHEQIRPSFKEPLVHFALVCAAVGCPPLRGEAYIAERLEEQLEDQARVVHGGDRWFQVDTSGGNALLRLTSLYDWYGDDFAQVAGTVASFAGRYSPPLQRLLDDGRQPVIEWIDYDWSLNSQENAR